MTRLKPSVSSCCASGVFASMLCTTADIPLLPDRFLMRTSLSSSCSSRIKGRRSLKEFLAVGFDIGGKAKRVIAGALFRQFGVALFERFDDRHMLGQRHRNAVPAPD